MRCMKMSATSIGGPTDEFRLKESDLEDSPDGSVVLRRYKAKKRLSIHPDIADVKKEIVKKAAELAVDKSRVVVFVRSPEDAQKIADDMRKVASKKGSAHVGVEVLTGTMRGLERDRFLGKPVVRRFLDAESGTADGPVVLVSTSAGEVGFDLNADHLVCDAAPLDSIIQRFGRVNRRGEGAAEVHLFVGRRGEKEESKKAAEDGPPLRAFEAATRKAVEILRQLPSYDDGSFNASPKALDDLDKPDEALSPKPVVVKLTDILLDAWSMTTIVEPMPGRPPVANWLRGIANELSEATISWRAELEIAGFAELDIVDIEEWFDAHRVLPHETLTLPSHKAGQLLRERWMSLGEDRKTKLKNAICIIDQGGLRVVHLVDLMDDLEKKSQSLAINADIILPASFGGIQRGVGMLDPSKPEHAADPSNVADGIDTTADVADETDDARMRRYRLVRTDGDEHPILGELPAGKQCQNLSEFTLDMPTDGDTTRQLVSLVPKRQRPELGTQTQGLADHVVAVVRHAKTMADRLNLQGTPRDALMLAAQWHDQGKARELWQRAVGGNTVNPLAKSAGKMQPIRSGYRHEFGSLRDIMSRAVGEGNTQPEVLDLAAHMVAAHHGRSRPHFPRGGFDPDARPESEAIAAEAMRRFAKLQKKYGWWYLAWLENLLRCADAMASAESTGENGK
jgi:CRISPR-associated endonuclease/helicase Cas3